MSILLDGQPVRSHSRATSIGPYVLVLDTVLPERAIELHSTYTGHPSVKTISSHLPLAPDIHESFAVEHDHDQLPVIHARRRCLYDHLHQLQDLLDRAGLQASIPLDEEAIAALEH